MGRRCGPFSAKYISMVEEVLGMCFYYDGSNDIHVSRRVKTRKRHSCEGCFKKIPAGSIAQCKSGLFDGSWFRYYVCNRCERLTYAIAADELLRGCRWENAWISPSDLMFYFQEHPEIQPLGLRTLDDCLSYVNGVHERLVGRVSLDSMA